MAEKHFETVVKGGMFVPLTIQQTQNDENGAVPVSGPRSYGNGS